MSNDFDTRPVHELSTEELADYLERRSDVCVIGYIGKGDCGCDQAVTRYGGSPVVGLGLVQALKLRMEMHLAQAVAESEEGDEL